MALENYSVMVVPKGALATGDIVYRTSGGEWARKAVGSTDDLLSVTGGIPAYKSLTTIMDNQIAGSNGYLARRSGGIWIGFDCKTSNQFVVGDGTNVVSSKLVDVVKSIVGGTFAAGDMFYTAGSDFARIAAGSSGAFLKCAGTSAPTWSFLTELLQFNAGSNQPPSSSYATFDTRNNHLVIDFDAAATEYAIFTGIIPAHYGGGTINVDIVWAATTATSGDVVWQGEFEADGTADDIGSDSFGTAVTATATAPGTSGYLKATTLAFDTSGKRDSVAAGTPFRLRIGRLGANGSDTMTGDAELKHVRIYQ